MCRAYGFYSSYSGRNRHRQGADCESDSQSQLTMWTPVRKAQLRCHSFRSAGERAFWSRKGSFHRSDSAKDWSFRPADQGTLFLDEVGDIPPGLQPKLLRVLQEQEFERLGSTRTHQVDVRLVAATNRNFVEIYARRMDRQIEHIPPETMSALTSYQWPGNIRELQNFIERSVIVSSGSVLRPPLASLKSSAEAESLGAITLEQAEREHILKTLEQTRWVVAGPNGAAARLGIKRSTLYFRMQKLGISRANKNLLPA